MSAYIVSKDHINAMLDAAMAIRYKPFSWYHNEERHILDDKTVNQVGQMLLDENVKSVSCRYEDSTITNMPGAINAEWLIPFEYQIRPFEIPTGLQAISITRCYIYQACEHPEWEVSNAKAFCEALIESQFALLEKLLRVFQEFRLELELERIKNESR